MKKRMVAIVLAFFFMAALLPSPALANDTGAVGQENIFSVAHHASFVDKDGVLWMWGDNSSWQLGNGTTIRAQEPVRVLDKVASVSCGSSHTAAIKTDGTLWMWGDNTYGKLGNGTTKRSYEPIKVLDNVAAVSCGGSHTAALKTDGTLWTWGNNDFGQLGNGLPVFEGSKLIHNYEPTKVMDDVAAVSCGSSHTAAIKTDGTLWMWGGNGYGHFGNGTTKSSRVPVKVMDNVASVSCGDHYTAAIKTDGTLWMWGYNKHGQLGNVEDENAYVNGRPIEYATVPVKVLNDVAAVSCGGSHTAAIKTDGTLWTWGANGDGRLGNGTTERSYEPIKVLDNVAAVSCGSSRTAAVKADGTLWTWGYNGGMQRELGVGSHRDYLSSPVQVAGLTAAIDMPSYQFPETDTGSAAVQAAAQEGENILAAYQLADGLYYVLLSRDGALAGRVVKGVKEQGQTVWNVIQSYDEPAAQEELDELVAQELAASMEEPETSEAPVDEAPADAVPAGTAPADAVPAGTAPADSEAPSDGFPTGVVIAVSAAVLAGAGAIGAGAYTKKKKIDG